jgi:hypothetical protein
VRKNLQIGWKMKQLKVLIYIGVMFITSVTNVFAKDNYVFSASLVGMSMDYKEYDTNGVLLDSEESDFTELSGIDMSIDYILSKDVLSQSKVELNLMILGGDTLYKGSILGSGDPYGSLISTTENIVIDTDVSYKQSNVYNDFLELNYGIGFGYRYWERALSASQIEEYKWYSLRPMVGANFNIQKNLNIGVEVEYQYGLDTKMTSSNPNLEFKLGSADIWEISFPVNYKYSEKIDFIFEAVFQKQTIDESNVVSGFYEPDSTAYNNYLKFGLAYKF